MFKVMAELCKL